MSVDGVEVDCIKVNDFSVDSVEIDNSKIFFINIGFTGQISLDQCNFGQFFSYCEFSWSLFFGLNLWLNGLSFQF